ncbi:MAG: hypothetical protein HRT38_19035 [Alteromonadaceae bacterium]|nr:hypothetical protein [Alteromonadaceae bacterium]
MTTYSVKAINNSNNNFKIYMFQTSPDLAEVGFLATAWQVSEFKIPKDGGFVTFDWSVDYGVQWSATKEVEPGVIITQGAAPTPMDLGPGGDNYTDFSFADDTPHFTGLKSEGTDGSAFISTMGADPIIPSNTFAFGLTVADKLAFAAPAQNGLLLTMTPKVIYWITAGDTIVNNEVLAANIGTAKEQFKFQGGLNNAEIILDINNVWGEPQYSAAPF